jgi:hypothetical protein
MDLSRTHEANQEQSLWMWLVIGVVVAGFVVAIAVSLGSNAGDETLRVPGQAQAQAPPERLTADYARHGQGRSVVPIVKGGASLGYVGAATDIREGGTYAGEIPLGTPTTFDGTRETPVSVPALTGDGSSTFTEIREGGEYKTAAQDPTPGPAPGR